MEERTLTFLFSDIEGSTRRWEADAVAMSAVLARHDRLVRRRIEAAGGRIFKHTGDGVCAVFDGAPAAMAAAMAVQRALQGEDWGDLGPLRVRMALHTGAAEQRAEDYFGPTLNRVARLMATAHGGQIIASRSTMELGVASLPAEAAFVDLGEHRLADLAQAEHIFQIAHPDLPADFPPLRSLNSRRHNLPFSPTPFVGRERELAEVEVLLREARLVTLVGVGGAGKTRLALETAGRALVGFPDGVFFVELAALTDPDLVAAAVVSAVGLVIERVEPGPTAVLVRLAEHLARRQALIVLDNCEHLVEPAAQLVDTLLRGCPDVTLLATSREPLGVPGEELWRIPSLSLPLEDAAPPDVVAAADAVAFLCDRARAADPAFHITPENATALAQICRRLDGIPLALELAAARLRLLSPAEVATRLDDRFRLLTAGARTVLDRHRTLRAAVDWGYELLTPSEQAVLRQLSVFSGGFDLDAAEAVVSPGQEDSGDDVLDVLGRLVDRSWVVVEPGGARTRYRLLETIRQYAAEKLAAAGGLDEVRRRHAEHFRGTASFKRERPLPAPSWMRRVDTDLDNVRVALECLFAAGELESCMRMTAGLSRFWAMTGRTHEGRVWLERVLAAAPASPSVGLVGALSGMGFLRFQAGEPPAVGLPYYERARTVAKAIGDRVGYAMATGHMGFRALQRGDLDEAERLTKEALEEFRLAEDRGFDDWGEWSLGCLAYARGDRGAAMMHFERVLALARGDDDSFDLLTHALAGLAYLNAETGDAACARGYADDAIEAARRLRLPHYLIMALIRAAETMFRLGDLPRSAEHLEASLSLLGDMEGLSWVAYSLELSALLAVTRDRVHEGTRILGAAQALDRVSGEASEGRPLHGDVAACMAKAADSLGADVMATELAAGAALPVKEAIALALAELAARDQAV